MIKSSVSICDVANFREITYLSLSSLRLSSSSSSCVFHLRHSSELDGYSTSASVLFIAKRTDFFSDGGIGEDISSADASDGLQDVDDDDDGNLQFRGKSTRRRPSPLLLLQRSYLFMTAIMMHLIGGHSFCFVKMELYQQLASKTRVGKQTEAKAKCHNPSRSRRVAKTRDSAAR